MNSLGNHQKSHYLRMYWAKKILEWSADPKEAWRWAIHLNNKYSLDGRDPSSYTGVGWCWGLHDREFPEIFFLVIRRPPRSTLSLHDSFRSVQPDEGTIPVSSIPLGIADHGETQGIIILNLGFVMQAGARHAEHRTGAPF